MDTMSTMKNRRQLPLESRNCMNSTGYRVADGTPAATGGGGTQLFWGRLLTIATMLICATAAAIPVMDVHIEDLMSQASDINSSLNLNPNQQTLWQQTELKMHAILGARQRRRDLLQATLKKGLDDPRAELRDLAKSLQNEDDLSYQENKQLRELWLTINDALDDNQRQTVLRILSDQLQRVPDSGCAPQNDKPQQLRRAGRQRPGGMNDSVSQ